MSCGPIVLSKSHQNNLVCAFATKFTMVHIANEDGMTKN